MPGWRRWAISRRAPSLDFPGLRGLCGACQLSGLSFSGPGPSWPLWRVSALRPFVFGSGAFVASVARVGPPAFRFRVRGLRGLCGACRPSGLSFSGPGPSWRSLYVLGLRPFVFASGAFVALVVRVGPPAFRFRLRGLRGARCACWASGLSFSPPGPSWRSLCVLGLRPFVFASGAFVGSSVRVGAPALVFTSWGLRGPVLLSGVAGLRFHVRGPSWPSRCLSGLRPFVFASGVFVGSSVCVGPPAFVFTSRGLRFHVQGPSFSRPGAFVFTSRGLRGRPGACRASGLSFSPPGPSWPLRCASGLRPSFSRLGGFVALFCSPEWPAFVFASVGLRGPFSFYPAPARKFSMSHVRGRLQCPEGAWPVLARRRVRYALGLPVCGECPGAALSSLGGPAPGGAVGAWSGGCWHFGPGSSSGSLPLSIAVGQPSGRMSASIMCSASLAGSGDGASSWRSASAWARSASGPCAAGPRVPMVFRSW